MTISGRTTASASSVSSDLAPGKPVTCIVQHADGTSETLSLNHSYAASQLEWFRRGSALNLFHEAAAS